MSLLQRINANQNANQQSNRSGSPFRRTSNSSNNQQSGRLPGSSPFNSRPSRSPFGRSENLNLANVITPAQSTVVRFALDGMGDPFYRLLGQDMNPEYSQIATLAQVLQKGGPGVDELTALLNKNWESYQLKGAILIFNDDREVVDSLAKPVPVPTVPANNSKEDDDDNDNGEPPNWLEASGYKFERVRSIDLALTLNVLTRARSQLLVARAPVVYGLEYLSRSVITDDPRLVSLAKATGALPDR